MRSAVLGAFFLSGVSALIYQVVWMRMLTLVFGNTVFAVSAVLSAFMAGLSLGSYLLGRYADRIRRPVLLYVLLEAGIGLYGLATPWLFDVIDPIYASLAGDAVGEYTLLNLFRFVLAFVVILVGTAFMGGTLPVLARHFVHSVEHAGSGVGLLYGLNTLGAVAGVVLSGFVLIPFAGVHQALVTAVVLNLVIAGVLAMVFARSSVIAATPAPGGGEAAPATDGRGRLVLIAFAVSGFAALGYEVVWTRVLALVIGGSVYAFATMLLTFLAGLAVGSLLMTRWLPRLRGRELAVFAWLEIAIAAAVLIVVVLAGRLPMMFIGLARVMPESFLGIQLMQLLLAFLVMLPATLLLGALFPLVCRLYTGAVDWMGGQVGRLYAANTVGAILGAVAAGFALIPWLGSRGALIALAALSAAVGLAILAATDVARPRKAAAAAVVAVVVMTAAVLPGWNPLVMNSNFPYLLKLIVDRPSFLDEYLDSRVLHHDEDVSGDIMVYRSPDDTINLHVNGHAEGGTWRGDMLVQVELATLPSLMHPDPERVLMVGLGPGITLGALTQMDGVEHIDVVEISPGVVEAYGQFADHNHRALEDERVELIIDDARHFLAHSERRYDLIVIGPSYAWVSGTASLFTREFLELTEAHLRPGGLTALWFHIYSMTPDSIKVFTRTVTEVFPHQSVWFSSDYGELIALGSRRPHAYDYGRLARRLSMPKVRDEVARTMSPRPGAAIGHYLMGGEALAAYGRGAPLNTDNRPYLEFMPPRRLYDWDMEENLASLIGDGRRVVPPVTDIAVERDDGRVRLPHLGLDVASGGSWRIDPDFLNVYNLVRSPHGEGADKRVPNRTVVPRARFRSGETGLELRASELGQEMDHREIPAMLGERLVTVTGAPRERVRGEVLNGDPLFWVARAGEASVVYVMTWFCRSNGMQYLGRYETPGEEIDFAPVKALLEEEFECYEPE